MADNKNQTFGTGSHMFATACCECGRKAHFLGEDQDGIRDSMRASGWRLERSGVMHPEVGELANFRCAECVAAL